MLRPWQRHAISSCILVFLSQFAWAQSPPAQEESGPKNSGTALRQRGWDVTPSIGLDLTHTDNAALQSSGGERDFILRTSPGIRIQGESARARAYIDFKLQQVDYLGTHAKDRTQRSLNGVGNIELVDQWLYLDLTGRISRQAISAFSTPASGSDSINENVVEATTYQVAPYIKGVLFDSVDYRLRFDNTFYSAKTGPMRDTTIQGVSANLSGATGLSKLNWAVDANAQQSTYSTNARNDTNSLRTSLTYSLDPQLRFTVIGGQESNDYVNFKQQTSSITGWGVEWAPTERTQFGWTQENRYFGQGHRLNFTHRTPNTAWRISDSRDVTLRSPQTMTYSTGTYFDLLNEQLRTSIPDDIERAQYVLILLQSMGISPQAEVIGGYMSSRASVNRAKEASFVWTGVRNTITLSAQSMNRTALSGGVGIPDDDFSNFDLNTIRQKGLNFNWAHKVTPTATLTFLGNKSKTSGNTDNLNTDRTLFSLMLSNKLGAYTTGSVGLRRTEVTGFVEYVENAILTSLLMVF